MTLDAFPLTSNGKLDRRALPVPQRIQSEYLAPTTDNERVICDAFARVLRLDRVSTSDHFFHLGGTSLLAVQLVALLKRTGNVEVPVGSVMRHPTPSALAEELSIARTRSHRRTDAAMTLWFDTPPWSLRDWPEDLPMVGLQVTRFTPSNWPERHTDAMGQLYVNAIREFNSSAPPVLSGFCRLGLVALETAYRLRAEGRPPAGVILVDSVIETGLTRWVQKLALIFGNWFGMGLYDISAKSRFWLRRSILLHLYWLQPELLFEKTIGRLLTKGSSSTPLRLDTVDDHRLSSLNTISKAQLHHNEIEAYWQASDFRPQFYPGPVILLLTDATPERARRLISKKWRKWCPDLTVDVFRGDHESAVRQNAPDLAQKVAEYSRQLSRSR
jgi:thioesterase domain-containing protein